VTIDPSYVAAGVLWGTVLLSWLAGLAMYVAGVSPDSRDAQRESLKAQGVIVLVSALGILALAAFA